MEDNKMKTNAKRRKLLAQYHILCQQLGMNDDERRAYLEGNYQVSSSRDLSDKQLIDAIVNLMNIQKTNANVWRRRVMAAIGAYLRRYHLSENEEIIKAIACRAAQVNNFNDISISKLRGIYNEFVKQNHASEVCRNIKAIIERELSTLN